MRFSFSPTKALAAMTEAVMMGTMRKNTGRIKFRSSPATVSSRLSPRAAGGSSSRSFWTSGSSGAKAKASIKTEGSSTVRTRGTTSRLVNSCLLAATPRKSLRMMAVIAVFIFSRPPFPWR